MHSPHPQHLTHKHISPQVHTHMQLSAHMHASAYAHTYAPTCARTLEPFYSSNEILHMNTVTAGKFSNAGINYIQLEHVITKKTCL